MKYSAFNFDIKNNNYIFEYGNTFKVKSKRIWI